MRVKAKSKDMSQSGFRVQSKYGMHQGSMLSPFLYAFVVDVITELSKFGVLSELLYVDDLVLMNVTVERLMNKFRKWRETFESKGLKVSDWISKLMVSGCITKDGLCRN